MPQPEIIDKKLVDFLRQAGRERIVGAFTLLRQAYQRLDELAQAEQARTVDLLLDWQVPPNAVIAALVYPLLENPRPEPSALADHVDHQPLTMAEELVRLAEPQGLERERPEARRVRWMLRLRSFFIAAYHSPETILVALARCVARMENLYHLPGATRYDVAEETRDVFLPLFELMGLWELRRDLGYQCLGLLDRGFLAEAESKIEKGREDNAAQYALIHDTLREHLRQCGVQAEIRYHDPNPVSLLRRKQKGENPDISARRIRIKVTVPAVSDCYRVLGIVQELWGSQAATLRDYIKNPRHNGYRLLRQWVSVPRKGKDKPDTVEFRIMTPDIEAVNTWGIVAARYRCDEPTAVGAWWDNAQLQQEVGYMIPGRIPPDRVIVFSPSGEVFRLPSQSTPIDYAYAVHSTLGAFAHRVLVNGVPQDHAYQLRQGDIVEVVFDTNRPGPNPQWLNTVQTHLARTAIRRALARPARIEHRGRKIIETVLEQELQPYRKLQPSPLVITPERLDRFLETYARAKNYKDVTDLYADITNNEHSPHVVVHRLIVHELVGGIVQADGQPVGVPEERVTFAHCVHEGPPCLVLPNQPIVGRYRRAPSGEVKALVIYAKGCPNAPADAVDLAWRPEVSRQAAQVDIAGWDQPGLLGKVLQPVYDLYGNGLYLYGAHADANPADRTARITLTVDAPDFSTLEKLQDRYQAMHRDGTIATFSVMTLTLEDRLKFGARDSSFRQNPYSEQPAQGAMFFDRVNEQARVLRDIENGSNVILLVGEKRVGKTSLLRRLQATLYQEHGFLPAVVDMREFDQFDAASIVARLAEEMNQDIAGQLLGYEKNPGLPQVRLKNLTKDPFGTFADYLERLQKRFPGRRPMVLLDEFNVLDEQLGRQPADRLFFGRLQAFMSRHREIPFVLAVQDAVYRRRLDRSGRWTSLQTGHPIPLGSMDEPSAEALLRQPKGDLLAYDDTVVKDILALTACHPYFIQVIARDIVEKTTHRLTQRTMGQRVMVSPADLQGVLDGIMLSGQLYFKHYLDLLSDKHRDVLRAVARYTDGRQVVFTVADIERACQAAYVSIGRPTIMRMADDLVVNHILAIEKAGADLTYRICVPLFARWLARYAA